MHKSSLKAPRTTHGHFIEPKGPFIMRSPANKSRYDMPFHISSLSSSSKSSGGKSPTVTLLGLTNAPREGGHVKYLFP